MKKSLSQHSQSGLPLSIIPTTPDSIGSPMVKEPLPFTVPSPVQSQLHVSSQHSSEYMLFGQPTTPSSAPISLSFQDPAASIAFPSQEVFQSCFRVNGASSNGLLEALHCDELLRSVNWSEEEKKVKEEVKEEEVKEVKEKEGKEEGKEEEVKEVKEEVKEVKEEEVKEEVKEEKVEKEKEKVMEEEVKTETDMTSGVPKTEEVLIGESDDEMEKTLREKSVDTTVMSAQDLLYDELNRTLQDGLSDEEMAENKTEEVTTQELEALLREDSESVSEEEEVKADSAVNEGKGVASEEEKETPLLSIAFPQEAGIELDPIPIMSPHDAEADSSQPPPIIPSRGSDEDDQPPPILIRTVEPTQLVTPSTSEKSSNVSVRSVDRRGAGNEVPIIASYFNSDVRPEPAKGNAERSFITVEPRASEPLLPAEREEKGAEPVPDAESDVNSNTSLAVKPSSDEKVETRDTLLAEKPDSTQTLLSSTEPATASASTSQSLPHDGMTQLLPSPITPSPNAPLSTQDAALLSSQEKDRIPSQQTIPSSIPLSSSSNPRSQSQDSTVLIPLCLPKEEVAVSAKQSEQSLHEKEMKESASLLEVVNYHVHFDDSDEASSQLSQSPPKEESGPVITDLTVLSDSSSEASEDDSISIVEEESLLVPAKNGEESESKDSVAEKEMVEMKEPVEKEEMKKAVSEEEEKVIVEEKPSEEPVVEEEEEKRLEEEKEETPSMEPVIEREKEMEVVPEEEKEEKEVVAREEGIGETIPSVEPAAEKEEQEQLPEEQTRPPEQQVQPPEEPVQSREEPVQTHKEQTQPPKQPVQAHEVPPQAPEPTEENEQTGKTQEQPSDSEDDLFYSGPRLSQAPSEATIAKPQPSRLANAPITPSRPEKRIVPSSQQEVGASPRRTPAAKSHSNAARLSVEAQPSPKRWKRASDQEKTVPRTPQRKTAAKEKSAAAEKRMRKALEALGIEVDVMRRCDV